jgi:hypothetical protein
MEDPFKENGRDFRITEDTSSLRAEEALLENGRAWHILKVKFHFRTCCPTYTCRFWHIFTI